MSKTLYLNKSGFRLGKFMVTWMDLWSGSKGLEVAWGEKELFLKGFKSAPKDIK